jgi:hypothetical protein
MARARAKDGQYPPRPVTEYLVGVKKRAKKNKSGKNEIRYRIP